jgi:hypothetical protein
MTIPKPFGELREIPWERSIRQRSLDRKVITLLRWRNSGYGPKPTKFGREWAYSRKEVEEFAEALRRVSR